VFERRRGLRTRSAAPLGIGKTRRTALTGWAGLSIGVLGSDRSVESVDPVDELWVGVDEFGSVSLGSF
jgi:hypothetical protein